MTKLMSGADQESAVPIEPTNAWLVTIKNGSAALVNEVEGVLLAAANAHLDAGLFTNKADLPTLYQRGVDDIVLSNDVIRTPNSFTPLLSQKGLCGAGQFTRWETALFVEYLCRELNENLSPLRVEAEFTIDGETCIVLNDWSSIKEAALAVDRSADETKIRALAEAFKLVTPRFNIAEAVKGSDYDSFF